MLIKANFLDNTRKVVQILVGHRVRYFLLKRQQVNKSCHHRSFLIGPFFVSFQPSCFLFSPAFSLLFYQGHKYSQSVASFPSLVRAVTLHTWPLCRSVSLTGNFTGKIRPLMLFCDSSTFPPAAFSVSC